MGKNAILLPDDYKEKAIANGLSIQTVYARIKRGWEIERAVTEFPKHKSHLDKLNRSEGSFLPTNRPKSDRSISFNFYQDLEEDLEKAVLESGLSRSEFISKAVEYYLLNVWQKAKTMDKGKRTKGKK